MQTIRVALGDVYNIPYTLTGPTINLSTMSPTPTIEVDVIDTNTGVVKATIPCTIVAATSGLIQFSLEDATVDRSMNTLTFRVLSGPTVRTIPTGSEQGLWVF